MRTVISDHCCHCGYRAGGTGSCVLHPLSDHLSVLQEEKATTGSVSEDLSPFTEECVHNFTVLDLYK